MARPVREPTSRPSGIYPNRFKVTRATTPEVPDILAPIEKAAALEKKAADPPTTPQGQTTMDLVYSALLGISEQLREMKDAMRVRENAGHVFEYDTATTNREETFNANQALGVNAASIQILGVGGGNLEIKLPDFRDWKSVGVNDVFENEDLQTFRVRTTSGATGKARIRVRGYVPGG